MSAPGPVPRPMEMMRTMFDGIMLEAYAAAPAVEWGLDIRFGPDPEAAGPRRRPTWRVTVWQDGQPWGTGADTTSLRTALEAALAAAGRP